MSLAVGVVVSLFGAWTGRRLLDSANDPPKGVLAALAAHADPEPEVRSPPRRRVVVVLLDGLGEAPFAARVDSGTLGPIAWRAAIDVGTPSLSRPVYHTLLTGVPQEVSGIRNNGHHGAARADTLADRVRAHGGRVAWALAGVRWFHDLAGGPGDFTLFGRAVRDPARFRELYRTGATLAVVHLLEVDEAGHAHGAVSPEYAAAADRVVHTVALLRDSVANEPDAADTIWFVGADHGHLPQGGHGGPEMAVRRTLWIALGTTERPPRALDGIHPATALSATIACALGIEPPREALSGPLEGWGCGPSPRLAERARAVWDTVHALEHEQHRSVLIRGGLLALALLVVFAATFTPARAVAIAGALVTLVAAATAFALFGPGYTLSAIRTEPAFISRTLICFALAALATMPVRRRCRTHDALVLALSAVPALAARCITLDSLGTSGFGPIAFLVLPATGLLPIGVSVAVIAAAAVQDVRRYWNRRRR